MKIRCDNCEKIIDVPDAPIGSKVACPSCGDVNVIRAAVASQQGDQASASTGQAGMGGAGGSAAGADGSADRAAADGFPPANGPEADVLTIRPSLFRSRPATFIIVWLTAFVGVFGGAAAVMTGVAAPAGFVGLGVGALALLIIGGWKIQRFGDSIRITTKRIIDKKGIFSRNTSEIRIRDIRHLEIRQTFWQRLWSIGDLEISTAASDDGIEIDMSNCPDPSKLQRIINLYR